MSQTLVQAGRWLILDTPLGQDVLAATEVGGEEGVSRLFEFRVSALSPRTTIAPADLLGKSATLQMSHPNAQRRVINGIVTALAGGATTRSNHRLFTVTVSPTLWLLDRTSNYKVFQNQTAVEIVETLLQADGVTFEKKLQKTYDKREYCVQYGETNLEFFHRLLAEEGIFYYFTHAIGAHKLVIADNATTGYATALQATVNYRQYQEEMSDAVHEFRDRHALIDAKWSLRDYDFEAPSTVLQGEQKTTTSPSSQKGWDQYRYPADNLQTSTLTRLATVAIEAAEAREHVVEGGGTCASFTPGHLFTLDEHPIGEQNAEYVIGEVRHEARDRSHFTIRPGMEGKPYYRNSFTCLPKDRMARSPLPRHKPVVPGPLTAVVVGASGDEIHTDKYGRIRIQFHWDRLGSKNETSSCFVPVAQWLAGPKWGSVFIPRVGMEVVVHFLNGDPDRPLVTGSVYNGTNMPPWTLADQKTKSGLLTRSTTGGAAADANELSFEDKKGEEKILFHAQKDFTREVENDDVLTVDHDQTRTIKNDRTTTISEGNDKFTISKGNRTEELGQGNDSLTLKMGNRVVTLDQGNDTLTIKLGDHVTKANAGSITLEAATKITLKCGPSTVEISPSGIKVSGTQVSVTGQAKLTAGSPMTEVSGDGMLTLKGGMVKIN